MGCSCLKTRRCCLIMMRTEGGILVTSLPPRRHRIQASLRVTGKGSELAPSGGTNAQVYTEMTQVNAISMSS